MTSRWIHALLGLSVVLTAPLASALPGYGECAPGRTLMVGSWTENGGFGIETADRKMGIVPDALFFDDTTKAALYMAILNDSSLLIDGTTYKVYAVDAQKRQLEIGIIDPASKPMWMKPATGLVRTLLCKNGVEVRLERNGTSSRMISKGGVFGRHDTTYDVPAYKMTFTDKARLTGVSLNFYQEHTGTAAPGY